MKKIGLFYGIGAKKTGIIAQKIKEAFGADIDIDLVPIEEAWQKDFESYDNLIVGTSTWFDGELPSYWDEIVPELSSLNFKGKKIALFGLGDQINYPDNFADGIGILAQIFESAGGTLVGLTSPDGYNFNQSQALRNDKLLGLIIDVENQSNKTAERIQTWSEQLAKEF